MRITVLILGLVIGLLLTLQSFSIGMFSGTSAIDDVTAAAGAVGVLMALGWLLASALVIPFPLVSTVIFGLTALSGLVVPTGDFGDLRFHGAVALILAIMSFFGWRGKLQSDRDRADEELRQRQLDARVQRLLILQAKPRQPVATHVCRSCNSDNPSGARFCGSCGTPLATALASVS